MKKVIEFKVVKIAQDSKDKLFAVLVQKDAPTASLGVLKVTGKKKHYRIHLDELPDGVELKDARDDGKLFTKDLDQVPSIQIEYEKRGEFRPFEPIGYNERETEVETEDGTSRFVWLDLIQ